MPYVPCGVSSRDPRAFPPSSRQVLLTEAVTEVRQERNPLRLRANPRVLKRAVLSFPPKRRKHDHWPQPTKFPADAVLIVK